jgi:hypothetical protein
VAQGQQIALLSRLASPIYAIDWTEVQIEAICTPEARKGVKQKERSAIPAK